MGAKQIDQRHGDRDHATASLRFHVVEDQAATLAQRAPTGVAGTAWASGKLARRPQLDAALAYLRSGDVLVITKLDRLGRSVRNLIDLAETLDGRGVGLRVLDQGIDTTTPAGRMFFHVLAALAEFSVISTRRAADVPALRAAA